MSAPVPRVRPVTVFGVLLALAAALRVAGLSGQPLVADDGGVAQTARSYLEFGWPEPTMWNHPRLRDLLVHVSLDALGSGPWGIKAWSVLFGALSVPAIAIVTWLLTRRLLAAGLAGLLVALDPLHVDFSRQGINDVYLALFPVAAIAMLLRYRDTRSVRWLAGAGVLLGLGVASKWNAAFTVGVAAALILVPALQREQTWRERSAELAAFVASLVVLPLALYLLTFTPWISRGHDLSEWVRLQLAMAHETSTHVGYPGTKLPGYPGEIVSALRWYLAPVWYVDYVPALPPAPEAFVAGIGNPLAWLATWPAAAWAAWRLVRAGDRAAGWLLALFLAVYLPFVVVPRPIWTNSALSVLPFQCALVAWAAARLHDRAPTAVRAWIATTAVVGALLWVPATGRSTALTDGVVRTLVSPAALDPRSRPAPR